MGKINLLDCTVREAPVDGLMFGEEKLRQYYNRMTLTGIDIVEVGFLKDTEYVTGSTYYNNPEDIIPLLPTDRGNTMFVALIDYGRFSPERLPNYNGKSIDGIRVCFKKHEWQDAVKAAEQIKAKGYRVFFQHVDTLSYTEDEIKAVISEVNRIGTFGYSIVDTFGSMYYSDLCHIFTLIDSMLDQNIVMGFHSHNNLMMASALSQEFVRMGSPKRKIMLDTTMLGAGRGAGNANLELVAVFLNKFFGCKYDMNEILDIIDGLIPGMLRGAQWGYSIPYFISGVHSSHVFNVKYLLSRHNIKSRDLTAIIDSLDELHKKQYDYDFLEDRYVEYFSHEVDENNADKKLYELVGEKNVVIVAPGKSAQTYANSIRNYVVENNAVVIGLNSALDGYTYDMFFYSNTNRYHQAMMTNKYSKEITTVLTSNILAESSGSNVYVVSYEKLIKRKWKNFDNSMILLLRLLSRFNVKSLSIAGFDGFTAKEKSYADNILSVPDMSSSELDLLHKETAEMLDSLMKNELVGIPVRSLTNSIYFT